MSGDVERYLCSIIILYYIIMRLYRPYPCLHVVLHVIITSIIRDKLVYLSDDVCLLRVDERYDRCTSHLIGRLLWPPRPPSQRLARQPALAALWAWPVVSVTALALEGAVACALRGQLVIYERRSRLVRFGESLWAHYLPLKEGGERSG